VGVAIGESRGTSDAAGESIGLTFQSTPLARHKLVQSETGNLLHSVTDQLSMVMNKLAALPERTVLVKCQGLGTPFLLRVHDIGDPYADLGLVRSPSWRADDLQSFLRSVHDVHSIYFTPTAEGERELERQRLERFLLPRHQVAAPLHLADSQAQTTDLGSERRQTENPFGS
jgi:hypothetical protein